MKQQLEAIEKAALSAFSAASDPAELGIPPGQIPGQKG